jgi:hypothetical protein
MWKENIMVTLFSVEVVIGHAEYYCIEVRRMEVKT